MYVLSMDCAIIQVCEIYLPYLTCSLRIVLLFYNQLLVLLLFFDQFCSSSGSQKASKAKNQTYQSMMTVSLKCFIQAN